MPSRSTPTKAVEPKVTLAGHNSPVTLVWDKAAMFRADELGVFTTKGIGFARAIKYVWCMLPDTVRTQYATPVDLAKDMPPLLNAWDAINSAISQSGEEMSPKNVYGLTSGRSQSSS